MGTVWLYLAGLLFGLLVVNIVLVRMIRREKRREAAERRQKVRR